MVDVSAMTTVYDIASAAFTLMPFTGAGLGSSAKKAGELLLPFFNPMEGLGLCPAYTSKDNWIFCTGHSRQIIEENYLG